MIWNFKIIFYLQACYSMFNFEKLPLSLVQAGTWYKSNASQLEVAMFILKAVSWLLGYACDLDRGEIPTGSASRTEGEEDRMHKNHIYIEIFWLLVGGWKRGNTTI